MCAWYIQAYVSYSCGAQGAALWSWFSLSLLHGFQNGFRLSGVLPYPAEDLALPLSYNRS